MNARLVELQTHSEHDSKEESTYAAMGVWNLITIPVGTSFTSIEDLNSYLACHKCWYFFPFVVNVDSKINSPITEGVGVEVIP